MPRVLGGDIAESLSIGIMGHERVKLLIRQCFEVYDREIAPFAGQPVDVVGFVHRPRDLPLSASPRPEWRGRSAVAGSGRRCVGSKVAAD